MNDLIAIGADHAGYPLKALLIAALEGEGRTVLDLGTHGDASVDYPDFGHAVAEAITDGRAQLGIVVCGSGVGISIAANRHPGIRAALCTSGLMARLARRHNDANVLALGSRIIGTEVALDCLHEFLATPFEGGRHAARVAKLETRITEDAL